MNAQTPHNGPPEPPVWEKYTDLSVGEILRRARVQYNLTLDDVSASLRIRASQLQALEENRPELLPGRVYAIGFVRAYAEFLALDGDKMVHLFKMHSVGGRTRPELSLPVPASESKAPDIHVLIGSLVALVVLLGGLAFFGGGHKKTAEIILPIPTGLPVGSADIVGQLPLTAAVAAAIDVRSDEEANSMPQTTATRITIRALDSAWLEIRNAQNKTILSRILKQGDSYDVPDQPGLKLDTGDAGALQILVDGQAVPKLGEKGDVKRGLALVPDTLRAGLPPVATVAGTNPSMQSTAAEKPAARPARTKKKKSSANGGETFPFENGSRQPYFNQ